MQAKERLYLTKDGKALVAEGDPKGASLYAAPGDDIPESAVKMFGLVDGTVKKPAPKAPAAAPAKPTKGAKADAKRAALKESAPAPNKEAAPGDDKGAGQAGDGAGEPASGGGAEG